MTEAAVDREIQGLFSPDVEDRNYGTLLAFVELSKFRGKKGRVNQSETPTRSILKYCRDCGDPHPTGSQVFFECPIDHRWRTSMDVCVHPGEREK